MRATEGDVVVENGPEHMRQRTAGTVDALDPALVDQLRQVPGSDGGTLLEEFVPRFLATFDGRLEAVREAVTRNELLDAARLAHSLAGSLGTFGARRLAADFARLEHVARTGGRRDTVLAELATFADEIHRVRWALSALVS
jgi:HPt (histidine-containing phosphotransfer) domain-containing protein